MRRRVFGDALLLFGTSTDQFYKSRHFDWAGTESTNGETPFVKANIPLHENAHTFAFEAAVMLDDSVLPRAEVEPVTIDDKN